MLDRLAMTNVNQNLSKCPIESETTAGHSSYSPLNNQLGLSCGSCFKEIVHSSKGYGIAWFQGAPLRLTRFSKDKATKCGPNNQSLCDSITSDLVK